MPTLDELLTLKDGGDFPDSDFFTFSNGGDSGFIYALARDVIKILCKQGRQITFQQLIDKLKDESRITKAHARVYSFIDGILETLVAADEKGNPSLFKYMVYPIDDKRMVDQASPNVMGWIYGFDNEARRLLRRAIRRDREWSPVMAYIYTSDYLRQRNLVKPQFTIEKVTSGADNTAPECIVQAKKELPTIETGYHATVSCNPEKGPFRLTDFTIFYTIKKADLSTESATLWVIKTKEGYQPSARVALKPNVTGSEILKVEFGSQGKAETWLARQNRDYPTNMMELLHRFVDPARTLDYERTIPNVVKACVDSNVDSLTNFGCLRFKE